MAWIYVVLAGVLEVAFALGLKATEGFTRLVPSVLTILAMGASIGLLTLAMKSVPVGTAYAVWTGIGASGAVVGGILLYEEPATPLRLFSIVLVVAGIVGLKVAQ